MQMKDLIFARESFKKLSAQDLSIKTLYKLFGLLDTVNTQLQFYEAQRRKLVERYCITDGDNVTPISETLDEFEIKAQELSDLELDFGDIELPMKIPTSENIKLSYSDLYLMRKFIEFTGEDV